MKTVLLVVLFGICTDAFSANKTENAETINWGLPNWPPFFIKKSGTISSGSGADILHLLQKAMTDIQHSETEVSASKLVDMWKQKRNICGSDMLFTPKRFQLAYFTPLWMVPPLHVIIRDDDKNLPLKKMKTIDVFNLIKNPHWKGVLIRERSYGPPVDQIIRDLTLKDSISIIDPAGDWQEYLSLISKGRTDYTIEYKAVAKAYNISHPNEKPLISIPITGYQSPFTVYVACTRSPWGYAAIYKIDTAIRNLVKSEKYQKVQRDIFVKEAPELIPEVNKFLKKRARESMLLEH